ncbi:MAG TPA: YpdA family putative bacillithiol disulfide reductase [Ignavibacteria bacterium]|nr:YpdA family putative bacillithiol disulfide reductase [Ignavibacteria bacterium]
MGNKNILLEVLIIGAGPIGLACGIEAKKNSLSYVIIEKGCLVNSIFNYPTNMTFFSTSERIEMEEIPFVSHGDKPSRREALEYYRRVYSFYDLNVKTYEKVLSVKKSGREIYIITTDKNEYNAKNVIVSTGYYDNANYLKIPGEDLPKVKHYFDEPHPYVNHKTAVIGAGNSAVDVALELYRVGAYVTMIIREDQIKKSIKYWVKPDIENRISEGSIKSYFNSEVIEIKENEIIVKTPDGIIELQNDFVFSMTGYHSDNEFLKSIGIDLDENSNPVFNKKTFETNLKGVYIAGVVCGGRNTDKYFIENSIEHSKIIIDDLTKSFSN